MGSGSWRVPLDDLTRFAIHDFGAFARLCGGPHSPLRFGEERRAYQSPAFDANLKYDVGWLWR
jgi:hypothetical protein